MSAAARSLVEMLVVMGIQGTVLAVLALAVVRAGALRPGWQAAVWMVVLIKFVLPWGPALPWSLADLFAALRHEPEGGPIVLAPVAGPAVAVSPSAAWLVLAAAWLLGAGIVLGRALVAQHRVACAARRAPLAPAHARALLASFASRPPRLVLGDPAVGPHVVGIFRPIIVIPPALLDERPVLCAVLLHELAHVRRRDALSRVVQLVACAVFFFWPVVRLASRRLDLAREAACDAWALETSEVPRPAYARLLVRMAQLRASAATSLAASRGLDARVAAVLGPPARARLGVAHALALIAWIAVALGGARTAEARAEHLSCRYTAQLAEALRLAHPEADRDGDGVLSREEACDFQAELRRRAPASPGELVSQPEQPEREVSSLIELLDEGRLTDRLCCNCERGGENSAPWGEERSDTCKAEEGASR